MKIRETSPSILVNLYFAAFVLFPLGNPEKIKNIIYVLFHKLNWKKFIEYIIHKLIFQIFSYEPKTIKELLM